MKRIQWGSGDSINRQAYLIGYVIFRMARCEALTHNSNILNIKVYKFENGL